MRPGTVALVGGGPGAPDLLTVRARDLLLAADVVVADRLGPTAFLDDLTANAEVIDVGKRPWRHTFSQEQINQLLIDRAGAGQRVVRLKGGDPFLLGRGGEEINACRLAGIEVEVVPGISSALAAPAAAEIPVTHRGTAAGVMVLSGHDELQIDLLVAWPHTIVVLMGMARLNEMAAALLRAGMAPTRPVAVIEQAWTPHQREVRGPLSGISEQVLRSGLSNPATIVIGDVVDAIAPADVLEATG